MANTSTSTAFMVVLGAWAIGCSDGMTPPDPSEPVLIANAPQDEGICDLIVDETHIFYVRAHSDIVRIHKDTMASTVLFSSPEVDPYALSVDESFVYWTGKNGQTITRMPRSGGSEVVLVDSESFISDFVVTSDRVYYETAGLITGIHWIPKSGGTPATILSFDKYTELDDMRADPQNVYFVNNRTINKIPLEGGTMMELKPQENPLVMDLVLDESYLYYAGWYMPEAIRRVPKEGGEPIDLWNAPDSVSARTRLAIDEKYVYWTGNSSENRSAIMRISKEGGDPLTIFEYTKSELGACGIAVDDHYIYWGTAVPRGLYRVAKPQ